MRLPTRKQWTIAASLLLLLLLLLGARHFWPDPQVAKVKALQQELVQSGDKLGADERRQKWQELRQETEKLSPAQREQLGAEARRRRQQELDRYFTLSPAEKTHLLDQQIDRMEAARRQMQARGGQGRGPGGNGPAAGNGGPPGGDRGGLSSEEREQRRKQRLDSTTPEERAHRDQFFKDLGARRAQRGLSAFGPGFGGRR